MGITWSFFIASLAMVTMYVDITARLVFVSVLTLLLLRRREAREVKHFPLQTWSVREVVPVYWVFVLVALITLAFHITMSDRRLYQIASYLLTLFAGFTLLSALSRIVIRKRKLSPNVIGYKNSDAWWFVALIVIEYATMTTVFHEKIIQNFNLAMGFFLYLSILLVCWPLIEEVFYLGMLFIPTSRIIGLSGGAVLVSLLRAFIHFNHNAPALVLNFLIGLLGCYLYVKTRRILVPLMVHSGLNFVMLMRDLTKL